MLLHDKLSFDCIQTLLITRPSLELTPDQLERIVDCHDYLQDKIGRKERPFYGINTGFGSLCDTVVSDDELDVLQENLIRSHACGTGAYVDEEIVRIMLLLKLISFTKGYSGIDPGLVQRLLDLWNFNLMPVIYEQGSLGASGDLAPLSHLGLVLIGEGDVWVDGKVTPTAEVYKKLGWQGIDLKAKEGLAIINGTQFSTAHLVYALLQVRKMFSAANWIACQSLESFNCDVQPFDASIHEIRNQLGQQEVGTFVADVLAKGDSAQRTKYNVQDPYSFRCIPQVHGASLDAIRYVEQIVYREINGVTDNPNIFPAQDRILSGGNFHAQPIALAADFLAMALAELGNIAERRLYHLLSGTRELPMFLTPKPGLQSGLMIAQYTAASIVSQSKQYCTPASIDSIVSSMGQEDHVSMAANAGTKLIKVVDNTWTVLAIEYLIAAQAFHYRKSYQINSHLQEVLDAFVAEVPPLIEDRILSTDIAKTRKFIQTKFAIEHQFFHQP